MVTKLLVKVLSKAIKQEVEGSIPPWGSVCMGVVLKNIPIILAVFIPSQLIADFILEIKNSTKED
jgi:hypothetical protein